MELMVLRNDTGEYDVYVSSNFPEEKLKPHMQNIKDILFSRTYNITWRLSSLMYFPIYIDYHDACYRSLSTTLC